MTAVTCRHVRSLLDAFVDGELAGGDRLAVSRHLGECANCEAEADALRDLGAALRAEAPQADASSIRGLAPGIVSRVVAEQAQSWSSFVHRAFEDWHWVMIGTGSLVGTTACALVVASVLFFGPRPQRADSLAGRLNSSESSAGTLFVLATPVGDDKSSMLMQFEGNGDGSGDDARPMEVPSSIGMADERALTTALSDAVTRGGRVVELSSLPAAERLRAEALLDDLRRLRSADPRYGSTGPVNVRGMWLVTSTSVSAKAL